MRFPNISPPRRISPPPEAGLGVRIDAVIDLNLLHLIHGIRFHGGNGDAVGRPELDSQLRRCGKRAFPIEKGIEESDSGELSLRNMTMIQMR